MCIRDRDPVIQIGGEIFIGWADGQKPWEEPDINPDGLDMFDWMGGTLKQYYADLDAFARQRGYPVRWAVQFKESKSGGRQIPVSESTIRNQRADMDRLVEHLGPYLSYMTCSMHYRRRWETWLGEPEMIFGFITDQGQGTLREIRQWFRSHMAEKGYPEIDLIPHANRVGCGSEGLKEGRTPQPAEDWQIGLMAAQYLMDLIHAGYDYAYGFPGFYGDHKAVSDGLTGMTDRDTLGTTPLYHAGRLIGEVLRQSDSHEARLLRSEGDKATVTMVLQPASTGQERPIYVYLLHKRAFKHELTVAFDTQVSEPISVCRYSQNEPRAPRLADPSIVAHRDPDDASRIRVTVTPYSLTRVEVLVRGAPMPTPE